ncbi:hypothetical protein CJF30_00011429 [Rutstroemia sp. NJR-2017a BBW]|nr:hypothetical protein CJF30_00011429 [Rutstroemia sp. NJR-2017a BBW]
MRKAAIFKAYLFWQVKKSRIKRSLLSSYIGRFLAWYMHD